MVWDHELEEGRAIWLSPGQVLVFDGDVVHAGAGYVCKHPCAHMYLEVPGITRKKGYTWSPRVALDEVR
eukprot:6737719-Prymnesium_polylepis.1